MERIFFSSLVTFLVSALASPCLLAAEVQDDNVVVVTVSKFNVPTISITVCVPGTNICSEIPNVMIDSGSDGLRLFGSLLPMGLKPVSDTHGNSLAICGTLGGGASSWGPIVTADVVLGQEKAASVPMLAIDANFANVPVDCAKPMKGPADIAGVNGILGIGTGLRDLSMAAKVPSNGFYSCGTTSCAHCPMTSTTSWASCGSDFPHPFEDLNPIAFLPLDNNGWLLQLPTVPATGSMSAVSVGFVKG